MKKNFFLCAAFVMSAFVTAQTVSTSSVLFANCQTEYSTETYYFGEKDFPVTVHGMEFTGAEMKVFDTINNRGCDLLIDVNVVKMMGVLYAHTFSVKASGAGSKVYFSKGNLQYISKTYKYRFADNQYISLLNTANNTTRSSSSNDPLDLMGNGCSGYNKYPWYQYDDNNNGQKGNYDIPWRNYSNITNGGTEQVWYVLTETEWDYLLNKRTNFSDLRTLATVAGYTGMLLLPDDWKGVEGIELTNTLDNFTSNVISSSNWSKLEKAGAIFLPSTGLLNGGSWASSGGCPSRGYYTTTTGNKKMCFQIDQTPNLTFTNVSSWLGSVRAVRAAN